MTEKNQEHWNCETCKIQGTVEWDQGEDVYTVMQRIWAAHSEASPDCQERAKIRCTTLEAMLEATKPLEGKNDGVVNPDREVVSHLKPQALSLIYRKLSDDFTMVIQEKGKTTGIPVPMDIGLAIMYTFDPEAYDAVQKMRK